MSPVLVSLMSDFALQRFLSNLVLWKYSSDDKIIIHKIFKNRSEDRQIND